MIVTLAWSEGNFGGYGAHSNDIKDYGYGNDCWNSFDKSFHFSRGLGPFQITIGDIDSKGKYPDLGLPWSKWKLIEKLNSDYALKSTLYRHQVKLSDFKIDNLESLRSNMPPDWNGYQYASTKQKEHLDLSRFSCESALSIEKDNIIFFGLSTTKCRN